MLEIHDVSLEIQISLATITIFDFLCANKKVNWSRMSLKLFNVCSKVFEQVYSSLCKKIYRAPSGDEFRADS